jgi:arylsulfatase A-like enzyme
LKPLLALLTLFVLTLSAVSAPPNILFLCSDDQRADTIAALGNPNIKTPNLDRLVGEGTAFTNAFCQGSTVTAVCAPSRAMFLTGKSLFRATDPNKNPHKELPNSPTWPEVMRNAGYVTIGIGKWHNPVPLFARSFSGGGPIFFGGMSDQFKIATQDFDPSGKYQRPPQRLAEKHSSELFADGAVRYLEAIHPGSKPFMLFVAFTAPHDPRDSPSEYKELYDPAKLPLPPNFLPKPPFDNGELEVRDEKLLPRPRTAEKIREELAKYYAMITHLDAQIGRILEALSESGQAANTLIVFTSDHGLAIGSHGLLGKQNLYDHSMRAPLFFTGPGVPKNHRSPAQCYLFDIFPTVCELTGISAPETVEGKSLVPLFTKPDREIRDYVFGAYRNVQRCVRTPEWKLIRYPKIDREQLFNIAKDPDEVRDLSADPTFGKMLAELREKLAAAQKEHGDPLLNEVAKSSRDAVSPP